MATIENFCGQGNGYSVSKTLRFELIPMEKTLENISKGKFLESDKKKSDDYKDVKKIIDNYHRYFIDDVLKLASFNWVDLAKEINEYSKTKSDDTNLLSAQQKQREEILKVFNSDKRFKSLTASTPKELFNNLLPEWFEKDNSLELKKEAIETFKKFTSYFTGFQDNRKNVYKAEEIPTAVPYRIVNDNFPKFLSNISVFETIQKKCPEVIAEVENELKDYLGNEKLSDIFTIQFFNKYLCQSGAAKQRGIDFYNQIIGGIVEKDKEQNLRGINQFLNLYWQQHPEFAKNNKRIKMVPLFKQILSDRTTLSFKIESIDSDEELKLAILDCANKLEEKSKEDGKSIFEKCCELFDSINEQDLNEIYINRKDINNFSRILTGDWAWLQTRMNYYAEEKFTTKAEKTRWVKALEDEGENKSKGFYTLAELNDVLKYSSDNIPETNIRITDYFGHRYRYFYEKETGNYIPSEELVALSIEEMCDDILLKRKNMDKAFETSEKEKLQEDSETVSKIKDYLDLLQELLHRVKPLKVNGVGESSFYANFDTIYSALKEVISVYNKTRNYLTKKAATPEKYKLNFDCPTLAKGWDANQESSNDAFLMRKEGKYYLGIFNPKNKPKFLEKYEINNEDCYEKVIYKQMALPMGLGAFVRKCFGTAQKYGWVCPKNCLNSEGKIIIKDEEAKENLEAIINCYKDFLDKYEKDGFKYKNYNFNFLDSASYKKLSEFFKDVEPQGYKLSFTNIPVSEIEKMVEDGKLYLFQIYNKDFSPESKGTPNMHTLYWKNLFSEENLKDVCLKLNGEAELFYRPVGIKNPIVHKKDSYLVNKLTKDGKSIPESIYEEIYKNANGKLDKLSKDAEEYKNTHDVVIKVAKHDIIKDKHYTVPKFLFHVPITINFKASGNSYSLNENVRKFLKNNPDVNIIGLDRGERHLIYLSLINQNGEILDQFSFNTVEQSRNDAEPRKIDYHEKLNQREKERDEARKSWQTIGKIAELKEGYLSAVIHKLAQLMIKHNAIIVMEDLNFGFKRGRFHVEKQVYQKFEHMLIDKLNYLVFKDKDLTEAGGVLNGYQLANQFESFQKLGKQSGMLFYVPAGYTSKIDPKTGFVNMFNFKDLTNVHKKRDFFSKFESISFDNDTDSFVFTFDYKNFDGKAKEEMFISKWSVYSREKRIVYYSKTKSYEDVLITEKLKSAFQKVNIDYTNGNDLLDSIMEIGADLKNGEKPSKEVADFWDGLLYNFKLILQMRNSNARTEEDYIISPVKAPDGTFFDSREEGKKEHNATLPKDADANGAYHIALKGLSLLKRFDVADEKSLKKFDMRISNADWFKFVQEKNYEK
ncbi:MAG: type V CRISPR-associated protein Cas12a/Cpf1 [Spirochaetaceae bacterium]|nr:type V CRISPR-associated protein Cas12a/Cpf1 [Spirochaetaceae bacterium]